MKVSRDSKTLAVCNLKLAETVHLGMLNGIRRLFILRTNEYGKEQSRDKGNQARCSTTELNMQTKGSILV